MMSKSEEVKKIINTPIKNWKNEKDRKADEKSDRTTSSGSSDRNPDENDVLNEEYVMKRNTLMESRLIICRQWLILALTYYIARASILIYPLLFRKFNKEA